ncbi:MAG: ATP-binding protein [Prolixibacteraceae bacterium]|nr:ATP-binding protein [Prolixibacteraceae bacterium]
MTALIGLFLFSCYFITPNFGIIFIYMLLFLILSFAIMYFMLNRFISQKIKPLYRIIRDSPTSSKKINVDKLVEENSLPEIKEELEAWTKGQTQEIARLRDIERYRKEFVGNVSHELKTPIFNIQGYVLTLLDGGLNDSKINRLYLERAERSVDRMISIVEDLESITKLESGELQLKFEKLDIVKLIDEVFDLEQMLAGERNISLKFVQKPDKPVYVTADKKRITEVLNNLVSNAIKYNKNNGEVKVLIHDMEDHIMIEVSDSGIGIEKQHLPRVFERFFRVDKSRSREQGGTGLGLSIVKHIIEAHDQTINVNSIIDEGTIFTFTLQKAR